MHHTYEMTCHILTALYQLYRGYEGLKHIAKNMIEVKVNVMLGVPLIFELYKEYETGGKSGKANKMRRDIALSNFAPLQYRDGEKDV